jgi:hypothetical protein
LSRSQYNTAIYEAGSSCNPEFQQKYVDSCCVLDIQKVFDTTHHSGILHKLSDLGFSTSLIKLIPSFLTIRSFKVLVEGKISMPREIAERVPQGSILAPILYSLHINDALAAPTIHLALLADDTCIYATEKHESRVPCKLQQSLTAVNS